MDSEYHKQSEINKEGEDDGPSIGNVFQSTWLRCLIPSCDEMDRIFLGNRLNFLFHVSPIFWIVLRFKQK